MRYALVKDGVVVKEVNYDTPPDTKYRDGKPMLRPIVEITSPFNPHTQTYTISRSIQDSRIVDTWEVVDLPRADVNAKFLSVLAAHRYAAEESGRVDVNGVIFKTDERSCGRLTGAAVKMQVSPGGTIEWKAANGSFELDAQAIVAAGIAVYEYIQKCISAELTVAENISGFSSPDEVKAAFDEAML